MFSMDELERIENTLNGFDMFVEMNKHHNNRDTWAGGYNAGLSVAVKEIRGILAKEGLEAK